MNKGKIFIEKLIRIYEIQRLIGQFEFIQDRLLNIYRGGKTVVIFFDFDEYEKTHKEMQSKLQEIAVYFYSNREYFSSNIEEEILKLLEGGRKEQELFESIKNITEKV